MHEINETCKVFAINFTLTMKISHVFLPLFCVALLVPASPSNAQQQSTTITRVIYPADEDKDEDRYADIKEILKTALEKTKDQFGPYELLPSAMYMNGRRARASLDAGELSVIWTSTTVEKEKLLLPIRVPLRKGLLGYRVALITEDKQDEMQKVNRLADLRKYSLGQGVGWDDGRLYQANGITVIEAKYSNLFRMLSYGRFDFLPMGINEAAKSLARAQEEGTQLVIEKSLLIHYPWPDYLFVSKNQPLLHRRLDTGIRAMLKDGSFDAIFWKFNARAIEQLDLKHRRVIEMKNHLLPKETPLHDATLWFQPSAR